MDDPGLGKRSAYLYAVLYGILNEAPLVKTTQRGQPNDKVLVSWATEHGFVRTPSDETSAFCSSRTCEEPKAPG